MFQQIPQSRIVLYLMILGILPFLFVAFNFYSKLGQVDEIQEQLQQVQEMAYIKEKKQMINNAVRNYYRDADHFYIDKNLESLRFLQPEIEALQSIVDNKNFAGDEVVKNRLEFLKSPKNQLLFSEGNVTTYPNFQETLDTQIHPVEINIEDLQKVLSHIEGVEVGDFKPAPNRPQLIIVDFSLNKKKINEKNEVLQLNMKILKREYL